MKCLKEGGDADLRELLREYPHPVDHGLLQCACDTNCEGQLRCLMEHNMISGLETDISGQLKVKSEGTYNILTQHGIPEDHIEVLWEDLLYFPEPQDVSHIKYLIQKFCSISLDDNQLDEDKTVRVMSLKDCLFKSICDGKTVTVQCIIQSLKLLLNAQNDLGQTPIVCAAEKGKEDIVEMLAKEQPDISIASKDDKRLIDYIGGLKNQDAIVNILDKVCSGIQFDIHVILKQFVIKQKILMSYSMQIDEYNEYGNIIFIVAL